MRSLTPFKPSLVLGFGTAFLWVTASQAAMAPQAVADALIATITKADAKATFDQATAAGNDVVLSGFKITDPDGSVGTIGNLLVVNPVARPSGGFTADRMTIDNGRIKSEDSVVSWQSGALIAVTVPSPAEITAKTSVLPFTKLSMGGLTIESADLVEPVQMAGFSVALGGVDKGVPHDVQASLDGIKIPAKAIDDADAQAALQSLGYDGFTVSIGVDGVYDQTGDTLTIRSFGLNVEQVGKLTITAKLTDVPLAKLADDDHRDELMESAKISQLSIRFENTGIVDRVLDTQAKASGMSRTDLVDQASGAVPFLLTMAGVGSDDFQAKLADQAAAFLKAPKSFLISAAPTAPIGFMDLFGVATGDPASIADALKLDVQANK